MKDACTIFEDDEQPPANFVLLTSDGVPLNVHTVTLSQVSPLFREMFSLPQSTSPHTGSESKELPSAQIEENSDVMIMLLKFAYPQFESDDPHFWFPDWPNETYSSCPRSKVAAVFWRFEAVYRAADKYDMSVVKRSIARLLGHSALLEDVPFDCYAFAVRMGEEILRLQALKQMKNKESLMGELAISDIIKEERLSADALYKMLGDHGECS